MLGLINIVLLVLIAVCAMMALMCYVGAVLFDSRYYRLAIRHVVALALLITVMATVTLIWPFDRGAAPQVPATTPSPQSVPPATPGRWVVSFCHSH